MQARTRFRPRTSGHEHGHNVSSSFRGSMMRTNPPRHSSNSSCRCSSIDHLRRVLRAVMLLLTGKVISYMSTPTTSASCAESAGLIGARACVARCGCFVGTGPYDARRDPVGVEIREMINVQQGLRKTPDGRWRPENRRVQIGRCRATSAGFEYTVVFSA